MSQEKYMARAAALQVAAAVREGEHLFCEELPPMDVEVFLRALMEMAVDASGASLALVGYGMSGTDLRERMAALGLAVGHVTADLHEAATWRNDPQAHPQIIALARGRHPGVSTLAHFPRGDTRVFARELLAWACEPDAELTSTVPHRALLSALAEHGNLAPLVSLSGVTDFLASWEEGRLDDELVLVRKGPFWGDRSGPDKLLRRRFDPLRRRFWVDRTTLEVRRSQREGAMDESVIVPLSDARARFGWKDLALVRLAAAARDAPGCGRRSPSARRP